MFKIIIHDFGNSRFELKGTNFDLEIFYNVKLSKMISLRVAFKEVFNGLLSQKYKLLDQILSFSDIFKQKSCILK
jgi:hypothetical protein